MFGKVDYSILINKAVNEATNEEIINIQKSCENFGRQGN